MAKCPTHYQQQPCHQCRVEQERLASLQLLIARADADREGRLRAESALVELACSAGIPVNGLVSGALTPTTVAGLVAGLVRPR